MELDRIICGDSLEELPALPEDSIDAIVTDSPYELGFMGKKWDSSGIAYDKDMWFGCLRVLKPGGHMLAFGGTRTYHRMACAIEDAGFEIRDMIEWVYGSGFPKSLDISKALDKMTGAEREILRPGKYESRQPNGLTSCNVTGFASEIGKKHGSNAPETAPSTDAAKQWAGFGSALKPAHEPIVLARKPLDGCTIAENVLRWGVGGLNIDATRISTSESTERPNGIGMFHVDIKERIGGSTTGRFPANLIHDGSPEVMAEFAKAGERKSTGGIGAPRKDSSWKETKGMFTSGRTNIDSLSAGGYKDIGTPARFFQSCQFTDEDYAPFIYKSKASPSERNGSNHPTMKPLSLMRYLCRLVTPPGGLILDPFGGSGTTCLAAKLEGFHFIGIEKEPEYVEIANNRLASIPISLKQFA